MSVWEIAEFTVVAGREPECEYAIMDAVPLLHRQPGCTAVQLMRSVEEPARFTLLIEWETVAHHTEQFAGSADFAVFIGSLTDLISGEVRVNHAVRVVDSPRG